MILVSGTGRCGTSMWMQVLAAAGLPVVGEVFPRDWETRIGAANPRGFYESALIEGINFRTNPDPRTGARLVAADTPHHVAKVFLRGVRRTSFAFLGRVLVSVRGWRDVRASVLRLDALDRGHADAPPLAVDPAAFWFVEHVEHLLDAGARGYAWRPVSYDATLADPGGVVPDVLAWLGAPVDVAAAVAAVEPGLRSASAADDPALPAAWVAAFDQLEAALVDGGMAPERWPELLAIHAEILASITPGRDQ